MSLETNMHLEEQTNTLKFKITLNSKKWKREIPLLYINGCICKLVPAVRKSGIVKSTHNSAVSRQGKNADD